MTSTISSQGMALASLDTAALTALYQTKHEHKYTMTCALPRDFMITSILTKCFGQDTIDQHVADLALTYATQFNKHQEQLQVK